MTPAENDQLMHSMRDCHLQLSAGVRMDPEACRFFCCRAYMVITPDSTAAGSLTYCPLAQPELVNQCKGFEEGM